MPAAAGVALGLDRLLMIKTGSTHIDQVLAFPVERA
jgi:lysyl-tRNA synthetase class 2